MKQPAGTTGLVLNEPLLWERGTKGRCGFSIPRRDIDPAPLDESLTWEGPGFPDLSEVDVVRHYTRLSQWNFGVDNGMYPLGSCTMKYNPKTNERQAALPGFSGAHPLVPEELSQGALKLMYHLERYLTQITGMDAATVQPVAGAHGEFTAMCLFSAYLKSKGEKRSKILMPESAHGTNPASATLCGFQSVSIPCNEEGILSTEDVAAKMDEDTAGIMVTNPNTLGLFEENMKAISEIIHAKGGLIYGDGANLNAVMGIVKMGDIGIDAMHLNLHKTFSTPHGGGGPGSGPVVVKKHLEPFLPVPRIIKDGGTFRFHEDCPQTIGKVQAFYGNFGVMIKAYAYILSMGPKLKTASRHAVLNANYIKESLKTHFHLPYDRPCMHECVFTDQLQAPDKVTTLDIAKRLLDYGFHPPTIYFPLVVHGAIMVEPTETESKETLDEFIETMKTIAREAKDNPDRLHEAPTLPKVRRLDETGAARNLVLRGIPASDA